MNSDIIYLVMFFGLALVCLLVLSFFMSHVGIWLRLVLSGAPLSFLTIIALRYRRVNMKKFVDAHICLSMAGVDVPVDKLIDHDLNGGNLVNLSKGVIGCNIAKIDKGFDELAKMDLKGVDLHQFVGEQTGALRS